MQDIQKYCQLYPKSEFGSQPYEQWVIREERKGKCVEKAPWLYLLFLEFLNVVLYFVNL